MAKRIVLTIILLSSLFYSFNLYASTEANGAVSTSTGGTGRGTAEPVDSILLNPALVSQLPTKFFSFNYSQDQWGLSIADNGRDTLFPAALSFSRSENEILHTQRMSLAVSYPFLKKFSFGVNASLFELNQPVSGVDNKFRQTTADVGFSYITDIYGIGLVANRVFGTETDLVDSLEAQQTLGIGTHYTYLNFLRLRFDVETAPDNKTDNLVFMGGLESYVNEWIIARLGYQNNNFVKKNYVTAGLGFAGPQFGLHYAYIANVADTSDDKHSIDLGIPF